MRLSTLSDERSVHFGKGLRVGTSWSEGEGKGISKPTGEHEFCSGLFEEVRYSGFPTQQIKSHLCNSRSTHVK